METPMDVLYIALLIGCCALTVALVHALDRLRGRP